MTGAILCWGSERVESQTARRSWKHLEQVLSVQEHRVQMPWGRQEWTRAGRLESLGTVRHQRSRQGPDHVWPWRSTHGIWSFSKQVQKPPEDCKHIFTEGKATPYLGAPTCPQAVDWLTYKLHLFSECWASSQHRKGPSWDEREKASCRDTLWNANPRASLPPSPGHHCPRQVNLSPPLSLSVLDLCFHHISYWSRWFPTEKERRHHLLPFSPP